MVKKYSQLESFVVTLYLWVIVFYFIVFFMLIRYLIPLNIILGYLYPSQGKDYDWGSIGNYILYNLFCKPFENETRDKFADFMLNEIESRYQSLQNRPIIENIIFQWIGKDVSGIIMIYLPLYEPKHPDLTIIQDSVEKKNR